MQLLPDLYAWLDETNSSVFDWTVQGDELRLTTAISNIGEGHLEIRGEEPSGGTQAVSQRIYNDDGTHTDYLAGEFIYHPEHAHIHMEDVAQFQLLSVTEDGGVGESVAVGPKVSFCLIDIARHDSSASSFYNSCDQIQGISAGWADVYDKGLPGQQIDITGVPNGQYWLEVAVDPLDQLIESDETNNVSRVLINIDRDGGPSLADTFEPNDSFDAASTLAPPEDHVYENLSIHEAGNDDYFRVIATHEGELVLTTEFEDALGDIDLRVYDADRNQIALSQSTTDDEQVTVQAQAGDAFYVQVYGYNDATNPDYTLIVDQADDHNHGGHGEMVNDIPNETQYLNGTVEHNDIFVINGNAADYGWGPTESGEGIVVWGPTGHDLLYDFDQIKFNDLEVSLINEGDAIQDIANVTQYLNGDGVDDSFVIDGNAADYNWGPTESGVGVVVWGPTGHDLLTDFASIVFNDETVDLLSLDPNAAQRVDNDPNNTQYLFGSEGEDTFVVAGTSTGFGVDNTSDGGYVIWDLNSDDFDLLYDFENIEFENETLALA